MDISKKGFSETSRWISIYPLYLNSNKTVREGRRILKEFSVAEPTIIEIANALQGQGFKVLVEENKMHPREADKFAWKQGRVRVQLKNDDGSFVDESFPNRKSVMIAAACEIASLTNRKEYKREYPAATTNAPTAAKATTKGKGKKK
uniref:Signal recognition particle 19 kDa protein n=1 Tax=Rhabditophanes sp. KR3021 TaxID=114890 RepID=A0AC35TNK8_9BILA